MHPVYPFSSFEKRDMHSVFHVKSKLILQKNLSLILLVGLTSIQTRKDCTNYIYHSFEFGMKIMLTPPIKVC